MAINHSVEKNKFKRYIIGLGSTSNTIKNYTSDLITFLTFCDSKKLKFENVVPNDYLEYLLMKKGLSISTVNRKLNTVKLFYKMLVEYDRLTVNKFQTVRSLKKQQKETYVVTKDEIRRMKNHLAKNMGLSDLLIDRYTMLIDLLYYTGLRLSEALSIKMKNIDFNSKTIFIENTKGKTTLDVAMNDKLIEKLKSYITRNELYREWYCLFYSIERNKVRKSKSISQDIVSKNFRIVFDAIGRQEVKRTAHVFRATFITTLANLGVPISTIAKMVGHKDISTTYGYIKVFMEQKQKAVNKL